MIELTPARILTSKAKRFALERHDDQKYGDKPYGYHLQAVVKLVESRMKDDPLLSTYVAVAWLHDSLEDTNTTYQELEREFGVCIACAVQRLTKTEDKSYEEYLQGCLESAIAREVKTCDTMSNLIESFMTANEKGMNKYPRQLDILVQGVYYERDH